MACGIELKCGWRVPITLSKWNITIEIIDSFVRFADDKGEYIRVYEGLRAGEESERVV